MKNRIAISVWGVSILISATTSVMLDISGFSAFMWGLLWGAVGIFVGQVIGDLYIENKE